MRIVVLDDMEMTSKQRADIQELGDVSIFEGIPGDTEEIFYRAKDAEILITSWTKLSEEVLSFIPSLRFISVWATGYDSVDISYATSRNIKVSNIPAYAADSVAELAIGLMLSVLRKIPRADENVRKTKELKWQFFQGRELRGKTLGVLGTGNIGKRVLEISKAFGMDLIAFDLFPSQKLEHEFGVKYLGFEELFSSSDIVSLHLPLLSSTARIVSEKEFGLMKPQAIFVNAAREALVDQDALVKALETNSIAGAGLDDIDLKNPSSEILLDLENVVLTPHIGFNTGEAVRNKTDICIDNVKHFLNGHPRNLVN